MRLKFTISVLLYIGVLGCFTSCQKELTCWGAECPGIAVYSFLQNNGACSDALVNGTYKQETELNDSNTVAIKVNVTKEGAYSISTDTVNGFYFISEGSFSGTGLATVILKSIGSPLAAGNFNFISSKTSGCTFKIRVDTIPFVEKYFYDVTIDALRYILTVGAGGRIGNYTSSGQDADLVGFIHNGQIQVYPDNTSSSVGLFVIKSSIRINDISLQGLQTFFQPSQYPYRILPASTGIIVSWSNLSDGPWYWTTYLGNQAGSNFTITSVETYADVQGRPIAKIKAEFNCILYNKIGQQRTLTNGKFYGEMANFLR